MTNEKPTDWEKEGVKRSMWLQALKWKMHVNACDSRLSKEERAEKRKEISALVDPHIERWQKIEAKKELRENIFSGLKKLWKKLTK